MRNLKQKIILGAMLCLISSVMIGCGAGKAKDSDGKNTKVTESVDTTGRGNT